MHHSFTIEVLSPTKADWRFYEALEDTLDGIQSHVYCVRKAFPSFAVRAIDTTTGQIVSMLKGAYTDD
jgi:hypothetical protein